MIVKKNKQLGFTLVEALVAISILLVAVVGPISLIGDSLHRIYYAKDEMIAINLAQEGVEVVRQVRDSNMLGGGAWDVGITTGNYTLDANILSLTSSVASPQPVYIDTTSGIYLQTNNVGRTITQFSRVVNIEVVNPGIENKVTSTVTWKTGGDTGTATVSENLFHLRP